MLATYDGLRDDSRWSKKGTIIIISKKKKSIYKKSAMFYQFLNYLHNFSRFFFIFDKS